MVAHTLAPAVTHEVDSYCVSPSGGLRSLRASAIALFRAPFALRCVQNSLRSPPEASPDPPMAYQSRAPSVRPSDSPRESPESSPWVGEMAQTWHRNRFWGHLLRPMVENKASAKLGALFLPCCVVSGEPFHAFRAFHDDAAPNCKAPTFGN